MSCYSKMVLPLWFHGWITLYLTPTATLVIREHLLSFHDSWHEVPSQLMSFLEGSWWCMMCLGITDSFGWQATSVTGAAAASRERAHLLFHVLIHCRQSRDAAETGRWLKRVLMWGGQDVVCLYQCTSPWTNVSWLTTCFQLVTVFFFYQDMLLTSYT